MRDTELLLLIVLMAFSLALCAQPKKVAILETVDREDNVPYGIRLQLRSNLTYAISNTPGYEGYDRVDMAQIVGEHDFQRTGMVSDVQIRKLGDMTGCSFILVAEAAVYDNNHIIITAKILNVETAGVENSAPPQIASTLPEDMQNACEVLAAKLIGITDVALLPTEPNILDRIKLDDSLQVIEKAFITFNVDDVDFKMIFVDGGTYVMGGDNDEAKKDEKPLHNVTIGSFYMGETEVTQSLWKVIMVNNPSENKGDNLPVEEVSWDDCQVFLQKLNQKTGKTFRLPTEAEWEYAARGGKMSEQFKYAGSNELDNVAWYANNSKGRTHIVKTKAANELGLYDMIGNVYEWCVDWYDSDYYEESSQQQPQGPSSGSSRVLRGGCFEDKAKFCRVSYRNFNRYPDCRERTCGFRLVLVP